MIAFLYLKLQKKDPTLSGNVDGTQFIQHVKLQVTNEQFVIVGSEIETEETLVKRPVQTTDIDELACKGVSHQNESQPVGEKVSVVFVFFFA